MVCKYNSCLFFLIRIGLLLSQNSQSVSSSSCPSACRCDGTFVYCNDRDLTSIPLGIPKDATILYLQNNRIKSSGIPAELRSLTQVEKIYLYCNNLDEFPTNLPINVKELHLQENNIRAITYASLAQIPYIEELHLDDNSVSAVSIEEGAFRDSNHLRLLFLSRNHLSSIPLGLPMSIEELRFDDNRISSISEEAMQHLINLKRLVLDGNLLNNKRIGEMAFVNLINLTELSLVRNSFTAPPANLPSTSLEKLQLQDNHIKVVPVGAFAFLRQLYRLDLSGNNLSSLPRGLFDDLDNITQLLLRNNPWNCDCRMKWVQDWLRSLPAKVNVRGLMCQSPDKVKGMAVKDLPTDLFDCTENLPTLDTSTVFYTSPPSRGKWPVFVTKRPVVKGPDLSNHYHSTTPSGSKIITLSVKSRGAETVQISWKVAHPMTALRLSWLKMGHSSAFGSITETIVQGERTEYLLTALEPESPYRICMVPMDTSNVYLSDETPVCIETETGSQKAYKTTTTLNREQEKEKELYKNFSVPLVTIIGGAGAFLLIITVALVAWYVNRNSSYFSRHCNYNKGRRRKDDYAEAGTKKDNTILEIRDASFQMIPINHGITTKEEFMIHTIFPSNGLNLYKIPEREKTCNRSYRDSGIPDLDNAHS